MARIKKVSKVSPAKHLINCLKTASALKSDYCLIRNNWIVVSDSRMTIAQRLNEDLDCCPHIKSFSDALIKCKEDLSFTKKSLNQLSIKTGPLVLDVPCKDEYTIEQAPDAVIMNVDEKFRDMLIALCDIRTTKGNTKTIEDSICLQENTGWSTNGYAVIEFWHGYNFEFKVFMPKDFAKIVAKYPYGINAIGCSKETITIYFDNDSLMICELNDIDVPYEPEFEDLKTVPVFEQFFEGVRVLNDLSPKGVVEFDAEGMFTKEGRLKIEGLPVGMKFYIPFLTQIEACCEEFTFNTTENYMYFTSKSLRGRLNGVA
jgi:hypothetical protein